MDIMRGYGALMLPVVLAVCILTSQSGMATGEELSEYLWKSTDKYHIAALNSAYIRELQKVTLDPTEFGAYNVQDAIYVYVTTESLNIAINRSTEGAVKDFLVGRAGKYQTEYETAFKSWHIDDPNGIVLGAACQNYVNHLLNVANNKDPIYLVVAMIPCVKLWPWLGGQIHANSGKFGIYNKWVQENLDPTYDGYQKYDDIINEAYNNGTMSQDEALKVYQGSMMGEVAFFDSVAVGNEKRKHDEF